MESAPLFRGQNPTALAFGTSGLRGLVEDLSDLEVWINVRGFIEFLRHQKLVDESAPVQIAVAGDLRPSTERIIAAVHRAVHDAQGVLHYCGKIPSPALAHFAFSKQWPSIMVTGSHIPFDRNGLKFNLPSGEVLKSHEAPILEQVAHSRRGAYEASSESSPFDSTGALKPEYQLNLPSLNSTAEQNFIERYVQFFGTEALKGLRLGVYQHSAVGRDILVRVLQEVGAEVHAVGRSDTFIPIDTEAVDANLLSHIGELTEQARLALGDIDAVVSTDGDSDRPLLVVFNEDNQPVFVRGDTLGTLAAEDLGADAVAIPVSSSDLVDFQLVHLGVSIRRTRIGSPWVIEAMEDMEGGRKMGFEANGGFLLETGVDRDERSLGPLPTRDAFLPLLVVLEKAAKSEEPVHLRLKTLPQRFTTAGLIDNVPPQVSSAALAPLRFSIAQEAWLADHPRIREVDAFPRSAEPDEAEQLVQMRKRIERYFAPHGLEKLEHINWVDGIRMHFSGGNVVHLRPSGNAPQFRVYVTASSMERAEELVSGMTEPLGAVPMLLEEAKQPSVVLATANGS